VDAGISTTTDRELVITRVIDAPRRLVFKAWTQPEHIARWWGPQGFATIHCEMDVRVGGTHRFGMRSPQGTDHWKRGVYREIVEPERIVFTFAWEDADGNPGHKLLTTVPSPSKARKPGSRCAKPRSRRARVATTHATGWTSCFERFADYMLTIAQGE